MKKSKTKKSMLCGCVGSCKCKRMDPYNRIVSAIWFLAAFVMAIVFVSSMSSAMAAVVVSGYDRQVSIGDVKSRAIATGVATATFEKPDGENSYDVRVSLNIPVANILSYQLFVAGSDPMVLTDMNVYGCLQQLTAEELNRNTIFVGCKSTTVSPRIPSAGDKIVARYYYIPGAALYNSPICGNGKKEKSEICDEGGRNGSYGHCNATCDGKLTGSCPSGFSGPALDFSGKTSESGCLSDWRTTSEATCAVKCTPTMVKYMANSYRCITKNQNEYACFGSPLGTSTGRIQPPSLQPTPVPGVPVTGTN